MTDTTTPFRRQTRRDGTMAAQLAESATPAASPETSERIPSLREPLITYEQGFIAALPVNGRRIYNDNPFQEPGGEPNPPYHEFYPGMPGYLVRVRDVPKDFRFPEDGKLVCTIKVVRVTHFNPDRSVKRVSIAVTGKPTDEAPNCRVKATGNSSGVVLADGVHLCAIDSNSAVMISTITQRSDAA